jgi:hypothetical protein
MMIDGVSETAEPEWVNVDVELRAVPDPRRQVTIASVAVGAVLLLAIAVILGA